MGNNTLPSIPFPTNAKDTEAVLAYLRQLYTVLARWQAVLSNTGFLGTDGTDSGTMRISATGPAATDGHDGDVWVEISS